MTVVAQLHQSLTRELGKAVVGQDENIRLLLIALCCEGHVLLEGVPGVAKTTLARALARALGLQFGRIQFTPDLMPGDILGTRVFNFHSGEFHMVRGPVFTNLLLADEINRAPAKTQSALLEAMQERQVSIEGEAHQLPQPFLVIATQNPVEQQGTYALPEAQLDRFLMKLVLDYPSETEEVAILSQHTGESAGSSRVLDSIEVCVDADTLSAARQEALACRVEAEVAQYIVRLVRQTREHVHLQLGASPRASLLLQIAARTAACLAGRDFVIPDDVKQLFFPCLNHRVGLTATAEVEGFSPEQILRDIAESVPVPR